MSCSAILIYHIWIYSTIQCDKTQETWFALGSIHYQFYCTLCTRIWDTIIWTLRQAFLTDCKQTSGWGRLCQWGPHRSIYPLLWPCSDCWQQMDQVSWCFWHHLGTIWLCRKESIDDWKKNGWFQYAVHPLIVVHLYGWVWVLKANSHH